jgi:hypothetical protein
LCAGRLLRWCIAVLPVLLVCGENLPSLMKELNFDFLVAADRRAIVETIEPVWDERRRFVVARQKAFVETIGPASDALSL